VKEIILVVKH